MTIPAAQSLVDAKELVSSLQRKIEQQKVKLGELEAELKKFEAAHEHPETVRKDDQINFAARRAIAVTDLEETEKHPPLMFGKDKHRDEVGRLRGNVEEIDRLTQALGYERAKLIGELPALMAERKRAISEQSNQLSASEEELSAARTVLRELHRSFYADEVRPAVLNLMLNCDDDRLAFLEQSRSIEATLGRMAAGGVDKETSQVCRMVFAYVVVFDHANWYMGDLDPLVKGAWEVPDAVLATEGNDTLLELAAAFMHLVHVRQTAKFLAQVWRAQRKSGSYQDLLYHHHPQAFEIIERKLVHLMKESKEPWARSRAEQHLDVLAKTKQGSFGEDDE
jgi:hypothetical protein